MHFGHDTSGEILTIYHEDDPEKKRSSFRFDEITAVVKEHTHGYVMLSGIDAHGNQYFLGHYHPDEEVALYREIELFTCPTFPRFDANCDFLLYILGRVNPSIRYVRDEDVLPIPSFGMLQLLAKRAKYYDTNDYDKVLTLEGQLAKLIKKSVIYTSAPGKKLLQNIVMSGATQRNV